MDETVRHLLSEISYSQKDKATEAESRMVVATGWREGAMASCCSLCMEFQSCKIKSSRDLLYNYVNIINNIVLHNLILLSVNFMFCFVFILFVSFC